MRIVPLFLLLAACGGGTQWACTCRAEFVSTTSDLTEDIDVPFELCATQEEIDQGIPERSCLAEVARRTGGTDWTCSACVCDELDEPCD